MIGDRIWLRPFCHFCPPLRSGSPRLAPQIPFFSRLGFLRAPAKSGVTSQLNFFRHANPENPHVLEPRGVSRLRFHRYICTLPPVGRPCTPPATDRTPIAYPSNHSNPGPLGRVSVDGPPESPSGNQQTPRASLRSFVRVLALLALLSLVSMSMVPGVYNMNNLVSCALILLLLPIGTAAYHLVTGANGFVGRHVVYSLLEHHDDNDEARKRPIVCLVRTDKVRAETVYWRAQAESMERDPSIIRILPYDMLDGGSTLSDALECVIDDENAITRVCVYHVASSFGPSPDPIRTAEENVKSAEDAVACLAKCSKLHPACRLRLVLTSSMAAVRATSQAPLNGKYYTNRDWNTESKLDESNWGSCYQWSKAESERRAWEMTNKYNEELETPIEMVSLCPSFVFGPQVPRPRSLTTDEASSSSYSITLVDQWLRGKSQVQSRLCADVRDVARAHVEAGVLDPLPESDEDRRFILSTEERLSSERTAEALKRAATKLRDENRVELDFDLDSITCDTNFDGGAIKIGDREVDAAKRLEELGVKCRPVAETMHDMAEALVLGSL